MADPIKPVCVHRDHYLDARLPEFHAAEEAGNIIFEPIARVVEIFDPYVAKRVDDWLVNFVPRVRTTA